jgi:HD-GYP domain-containing protein (c-di-GMP phosphodiesterase class II)
LGLKQDEIPIESQILMVADAGDAMTSERIYKKAKSIDEAAQEMLRLSGKQFPPAIVDVFLKRMDKAYNKAV